MLCELPAADGESAVEGDAERLMRQAGLQGVSPRWPRSFTRRDPAADLAPDLVQRDFTAAAPNRLWVADISLIPTGEGSWWLATIRDAFSRRIVGWHTSERADADLVLTALEYALHGRPVEPGKLVHHSDHGCQYAFIKLTTRLLKAGIEPSMGTVGDSYDNALAENFWSVLKTECVRRTTFAAVAPGALPRGLTAPYAPNGTLRIATLVGRLHGGGAAWWRSPFEATKDRNSTAAAQRSGLPSSRSPVGVTEDRNTLRNYLPDNTVNVAVAL